ncbi:MAG TPA: glycogen debranching N-terminal domain-containing protein [Rugosimonospora sp.]
MPDATEQFFDELARRGYEPKLAPACGTGFFDVTENGRSQQWLVRIRNGNIAVSRQRSEADFVVRADRAVFNKLVNGSLNALSAVFCDALAFEGDVRLLVLFQRLFPPPAPTISRPSIDETGPAGGDHATAIGETMVRMLDGPTFVVCDPRGDLDASPTEPAGLFSYDTRFLSKWILTINGQRLSQLSIDEVSYFEHRFFLVPGAGNVDVNLSVIRQRRICDGFCEDLVILSRNESPVDLTIRVDAASDFAHLFEVKSGQAKRGKGYARAEPGRLLLGYERETFRRETAISTDAEAEFDEHGLTIRARVDPHGRWSTQLNVVPGPPVAAGLGHVPALKKRDRPDMERDLETWLQGAPRLECDWRPLTDTYQRCLVDLAALRFAPLVAAPNTLPAAGLPWFMGLFGRDSIFTSLQALAFQPELAATTLRALSVWQGTRSDDFRDEDPGRILHELRYGELTAFEERPHSPYYGTADATPLFVVLLDEYERWTGDVDLVRELEFEARAALDWIDQYADLMGNGYVSYRPRNEKSGLENQCWKDSPDSISYRDGRLPGFPRATCELQGYAYDAKVRGARLAREIWNDPGYADRLAAEAVDLKRRFNRDFWIDDKGYFALALDADGRQLDALSSNIGHLLWSGIVDDARAESVTRHLLGPHLYSGWGVRTLGDQEGRYNPIGYHTGTVWPFDNSFIAWGLRRYGYRDEAARLAAGILDAATFFDGRLPEAFGGYERAETRYPVRYPTACSPQAWSTGAPLLFLRTMLGLEPFPDFLAVDPALPPGIGHIELLDIPGRWGRIDAFGRGRGESETPSTLRPQLGQPSDRTQR